MAKKKSTKVAYKTYCFTHTFTHCFDIMAETEEQAWEMYNRLIEQQPSDFQKLKDTAEESIECDCYE